MSGWSKRVRGWTERWTQWHWPFFLQITVTEDGIIGIHGWLPFDKNINYYYTFEKDATMLNAKWVGWFLKTTSVPVPSGLGHSLTVIKSHFDLFQEVDGEVYFVVCLWCCFNYFKIILFFLFLFNPFTAPACKIFRLKVHRHPCKLYFQPLYRIYFQCYAFSWKSFHVPVHKRQQKGIRVSNFTLLLVISKWHHGSEGVNNFWMIKVKK